MLILLLEQIFALHYTIIKLNSQEDEMFMTGLFFTNNPTTIQKSILERQNEY